MTINLQEIAESRYLTSSQQGREYLMSAAQSESNFKKIYHGRYVLELLQNSRDAIVESGNEDSGKILFEVTENELWLANNGAEFNADGLKAIFFIGLSKKADQKLIGHKGIGFNSVLEITENPEIITKQGSILFDNDKTATDLGLNEDDLPLFFFPHYSEQSISDLDSKFHEFTTVFRFPLKNGISQSDIKSKFDLIQPEDLVFFGGIKELILGDVVFKFEKSEKSISVSKGDKNFRYKLFNADFKMSDEEFKSLSIEEKIDFQKDRHVDLRFLVPINNDNRFIKRENNSLYLFYKLEANSGLPFIIHSFFSVNPDRKSLFNGSVVNRIIFERIGAFMSDFVKQLRLEFTPQESLAVLAFERRGNNDLDSLYTTLIEALKEIPLVFHPHESDRYLGKNQVRITTSKLYNGLFDRGYVGAQPFVYFDEKNIRQLRIKSFLTSQLKYKLVANDTIQENIEEECLIKYTGSNDSEILSFFQRLYNVMQNKSLSILDKKILLTEHGLKSSNETTIFYSGSDTPVTHELFANDLTFLHNKIVLKVGNETKHKQLGVTIYREDQLVNQLIKTFAKHKLNAAVKLELIRFVMKQVQGLANLDKFLKSDSFSLPVINNLGESKWRHPIYNPIYVNQTSLTFEIDDNGYGVEFEKLSGNEDVEDWICFLKKLNCFEIPAVYYDKYNTGQIQIHWPSGLKVGFEKYFMTSWDELKNGFYKVRDSEDALKAISFRTSNPLNTLRSAKWLDVKGVYYAPNEVTSLDTNDFVRSEYDKLKLFLPVTEIYAGCSSARSELGIIPLRNMDGDQPKLLLDLIYKNFQAEIPHDTISFTRFFHKVLSLLYEKIKSASGQNRSNLINLIKENYFLSRNILNGKLSWQKGKDLIHIDDNSLFESLNDTVRHQLPLQHTFTKRDKTEWGRFASHIGVKVSSLIDIIPPTPKGHYITLIDLWVKPECIIALIEREVDRNLSEEEILGFKEFKIQILQDLFYSVKIKGVETSDSISLYVNFFIEEQVDLIVYIDKDQQTNFNVIAELSNELIMYLLDDQDDISLTWLLFANDPSALRSILKLKDVDQERIYEIAEIIERTQKTEEELSSEEMSNSESSRETTGSTKQTTSRGLKTKTNKVEIEETEIENDFDELRNKVKSSQAKVKDPVPPIIKNPGDITNEASPNYKTNSEVGYQDGRKKSRKNSDKTNKTTGRLAEELVYDELIANNPKLLSKLGISEGTFELEWYNMGLVSESDLERDYSRGKGHDLIIHDYEYEVEIKGSTTAGEAIYLTSNEYKRMKIKRNDFFILHVENVYSEEPTITVYKNPYQLLLDDQINILEAKVIL